MENRVCISFSQTGLGLGGVSHTKLGKHQKSHHTRFFIGGYFYEIEEQLTKEEQMIWLAEWEEGKGKVT